MIANPLADRIAAAAGRVRLQAHTLSADALESARHSAHRAADRIASARRPARELAAAGLRFTKVSSHLVERLIDKQAEMVDVALDDGARRLESAASARDFRALLQQQRAITEASRRRLGVELAESWGIAATCGRELRSLATETYRHVVHGRRPAPKPRGKRKRVNARATARKRASRA